MGKKFNRNSKNSKSNKPSQNTSNSSAAKEKAPLREKTSLTDCVYDVGSSKAANDYNKNTEFIIDHVRQKCKPFGEDVGNSLKKLARVDISSHQPERERSTLTDADAKKFEQEMFDMVYKEKNSQFTKRKAALETNMQNVYSLLWGQCSDRLKHRLQGRVDYKEYDEERDPIKLLLAIRDHTHQFREEEYDAITILEAQESLMNIRQHDEELLIPYYTRFKSAMETFVRMNGSELLYISIAEQNESHKYLRDQAHDSVFNANA